MEIKKVEIVLKQAEVDTTEYMRKKQLKREIAGTCDYKPWDEKTLKTGS